MTPTLSILIPTKDREGYLLNILGYILNWSSLDFELIVQDNSASNKLENKIKPFLKDNRLKYYHAKEWLSVSDNFNIGLSKASGKVITMLGDDDGILEESLVVARWMISKNVDAVLPQHGTYTWPDLIGKYNSDLYNSKLILRKNYTGKIKYIEPIKELEYVLSRGGTTLGKLPRLYYGLIKKEVLDAVQHKCGTFFPGPSPDMANAASAAIATKSFVTIDYPLFIAGSCTVSAAGMGVRRMHEGEIKSFKHLPKNCEEEWEEQIPKYWSGPTIWAESAIKAIKSMKDESLLSKFNYSYFYATSFVFNYRRAKDIALKFSEQKLWFNIPKVLIYYVYIWAVRLKIVIPKLLSKLGIYRVSYNLVLHDHLEISKALNSYTASVEFKSVNQFLEQ
ncbi:glycosyltransferase family 2 protein [Shewanella sp. 0m-8]